MLLEIDHGIRFATRRAVTAAEVELVMHVADLPGSGADISGGYVGIRADMAEELGHKALAEGHYLPVGLALGVKVGAALAAAYRQAGKAVLEYLLKSKELYNR